MWKVCIQALLFFCGSLSRTRNLLYRFGRKVSGIQVSARMPVIEELVLLGILTPFPGKDGSIDIFKAVTMVNG